MTLGSIFNHIFEKYHFGAFSVFLYQLLVTQCITYLMNIVRSFYDQNQSYINFMHGQNQSYINSRHAFFGSDLKIKAYMTYNFY